MSLLDELAANISQLKKDHDDSIDALQYAVQGLRAENAELKADIAKTAQELCDKNRMEMLEELRKQSAEAASRIPPKPSLHPVYPIYGDAVVIPEGLKTNHGAYTGIVNPGVVTVIDGPSSTGYAQKDYREFKTFLKIKERLEVSLTYIFRAITEGLTIIKLGYAPKGVAAPVEKIYYGNVSLVAEGYDHYALKCQDITTGREDVIPLVDIEDKYKGKIFIGRHAYGYGG